LRARERVSARTCSEPESPYALRGPRRTRAGRKMIARKRSRAPVTAIPKMRKGNNNNHTSGYSTSARRASGQHKTSKIHQRRKFSMICSLNCTKRDTSRAADSFPTPSARDGQETQAGVPVPANCRPTCRPEGRRYDCLSEICAPSTNRAAIGVRSGWNRPRRDLDVRHRDFPLRRKLGRGASSRPRIPPSP
jgi:hypothetical protein